MRGWGCFGLSVGGLIGLLILVFLLLLVRPVPPSATPQPTVIAPDATVFLSERILSQIAAQEVKAPTLIDFEPNGQMWITTRTRLGGLEPVVRLGLLLELQGTEVTSRLHWIQLGFLTLPANWLPPEALETGAIIGQTINEQVPPDFTLIGLTTTTEGVNFQLKWIGR